MHISGKPRGMRRAFTLIELLITASIATIVSVAIFSVFAAGINVYDRVRNYSDIRTDILFSLEKIEKDIKNTPNVSQIAFTGQAERITFPKVISDRPGRKDSLLLGNVSYYIDNSTHYLVSEERDYSDAVAQEPPRGEVTPLVYAGSIKFSYFYYDAQAAEYYWKDAWVEEKEEAPEGAGAKQKIRAHTPLGVKIEIRYEDHGHEISLNRTVFLPLAASLNLAEVTDAEKVGLNGKKG